MLVGGRDDVDLDVPALGHPHHFVQPAAIPVLDVHRGVGRDVLVQARLVIQAGQPRHAVRQRGRQPVQLDGVHARELRDGVQKPAAVAAARHVRRRRGGCHDGPTIAQRGARPGRRRRAADGILSRFGGPYVAFPTATHEDSMTRREAMRMRGTNGRAKGLLAAAAAAGIAIFIASGAVGAQDKTVWDGVYTEDQAVRGETAYEQECATCHLADLLGDGIAPALTGAAFDFRWSDLSVGDMYVAIRATMPQGAPASLSPQGYADIVAYMLQRNDFPAGDMELPTEEEALNMITITSQAP
ncbi:MAG: cytochrome c [Acidobacteria bacterium]|nr:cytochrome c [Acidobacteriota bacterium]